MRLRALYSARVLTLSRLLDRPSRALATVTHYCDDFQRAGVDTLNLRLARRLNGSVRRADAPPRPSSLWRPSQLSRLTIGTELTITPHMMPIKNDAVQRSNMPNVDISVGANCIHLL